MIRPESAAMPSVLISAYAASPAHQVWDAALEGELLRSLFDLPGVAGFELPWIGALHPHDPDWLLQNLPRGAHVALTPLPWVMGRTAADPAYGLASTAEEGRAAALGDLRRVLDDVRRIADATRASGASVMLHTAPRGRADAASFARSLEDLATWEWDGVGIVIEHCDAPRGGRPFEKGFLPIEVEIAAIEHAPLPVGLWMNWGRSAIELREADAVTAQVGSASRSGHLRGLTFSGAADSDGPYGPAWTDTHPPILAADPESHSILDADAVTAALEASAGVPWLGVKVSRHPADRTAGEVAATVARNLDIVLAALPVR